SGSYSWSPSVGLSNATIATPTANPSSSTTYNLTVTGSNGCTNSSSVLVSVIGAVPSANSGGNQTINCATTSVVLNGSVSGGTPGYSYNWSPSAGLSNATIATPTATPVSNTNYTLTVTDGNGCSSSSSALVTVDNALPIVDAGPTKSITCGAPSATLNGSGTGTYSWSPNSYLNNATVANPISSPPANTLYTLTLTGSNGCTATDTVSVLIGSGAFSTNAGSPQTIGCGSTSVTLNSTVTGGTPTYFYSWFPTTGLSSTTIANPIANPTATTTYSLTITDGSGCLAISNVTITVDNAAANANAGTDVVVCSGNPVQLNGVGAGTYSWNNGATLTDSTINNPIATISTSTTYILSVTGSNGCVGKDTITITVNATPTAPIITSLSNNQVCDGLRDTITTTPIAGLITNVYATATSITTIGTLDYVTPVITATTTYYFETINTSTGCKANNGIRQPLTIVMLPKPTQAALSASPTSSICLGDSTTLHVAATNVNWTGIQWYATASSNASLGMDSIKVSPISNTYYYAELVNVFGCKAGAMRDSLLVSVISLSGIAPNILPRIIKCDNVSTVTLITIGSYANSTFNWLLPAGVSIIGNASNDTLVTNWSNVNTGNIYVMEMNGGCKSDSASTVLTSYAAPIADIDTVNIGTISEAYTFIDSSYIVLPETIKSWQWSFGDEATSNLQSPSHLYTNVGTYPVTLIVSSSKGCKDTATLIINIREGVKFSNVFSPNGDGLNDYFVFPNLGLEGDYKLEIFDRWGLLLFETEGKNIGWDGRTVAGTPVADGAYYYVLQAKSQTKTYNNKGIIMVMR
ncbi:MAG: gliding motility-associated C-terminal domain-containing protein, partial [Bacteroidia bacterium]|nr:gliding motility-associated C-terminal domain-containing protein [Bacteroidia bacterium]